MTNCKKNWICIFCLGLLLVCLLTGCGNKEADLPGPSAPAGSDPPVSAQVTEDGSAGKGDTGSKQDPPEGTNAEPEQDLPGDTDTEPEKELPGEINTEPPVESEQPSSEPDEKPEEPKPPQAEDILTVPDRETLKAELTDAIVHLRQPVRMDISKIGLTNPAIDIKNIYYEITAQNPTLKYAYDITAEGNETELTCVIRYMPYMTGEFSAGFSGTEVASLKELLLTAEENMGVQPMPVRITDTTLDPDTMNRALQQIGGGYVNCTLNVDATEIRYSAPLDMTLEECLIALDQAEQLADEVIAQVITDGMTQREQAEALYSYVTENVTYDFHYYSDRSNMPYDSQTALGALRDGTAICGGYSHAVKLLFEKVGITCFNVTGMYFRENHMWNYVILDGEGYYCDATSDRGGRSNHFMLTLDEMTALGEHKWDHEFVVNQVRAIEGNGIFTPLPDTKLF
ncbi:MAG: transglutaminase domain-containing protein [Oscillospiraceae bacterium]